MSKHIIGPGPAQLAPGNPGQNVRQPGVIGPGPAQLASGNPGENVRQPNMGQPAGGLTPHNVGQPAGGLQPQQIGGGGTGGGIEPPPVNTPTATGDDTEAAKLNPAQPGFDFESFLRNIMTGLGQGNQFTNPNVEGVPAFTPGANPFQQGAGQFNFQQGAVGSATEQGVLDRLKNPSRFDSQQAQDTFNRLNQTLQQQFGQKEQGINTDLQRRGIFQSTIAGGKLGDLASNQAFAQSGLASNIALEQARTFGNDQSQAIAQAMGFSGQRFNQGLQQAGQNFQTDLAGRQFNQGQNQAQFTNDSLANEQRFGQGLQSFGANQQAEQQGFNQRNTAINNLFGFGQQQFQNQLSTAQFNQSQDFQNNSLLLQSLGLT